MKRHGNKMILFLLAVTAAGGAIATASDDVKTVTRLTEPLPLRPGEVTNSFHKLPIPSGPIAISEFKAEIVEKDEYGNIVQTPLSDAYLHHHVVFSEHDGEHTEEQKKHKKRRWWPMKPSHKHYKASRGIGFGAGTEARGTPQKFYEPYAFMTSYGEDEFIANVHVINTRGMVAADAHHCLECPCTSVDVYATNGTIKESVAARRRSGWNNCNAELLDEGNTACSPSTYYGGLVCCEDGEFCLDGYDPNSTLYDRVKASGSGPISVYYLRYTLSYREATPETKPLYLAACCDATGNATTAGNIEYDIPKMCDEWDSLDEDDEGDSDCIHVATSTQMLHGPSDFVFGVGELDKYKEEEVDVVYMVGHLHRGGIDMTAQDANTLEVICKSVPTYGAGVDGIGDEKGYITAMSTCVFDPPRRMMTTDPILVTSRYDARQDHTGVMGLFYIAVSDPNETYDSAMDSTDRGGGRGLFRFAALGAVLAVAAVIGSKFVGRQRSRSKYEAVSGGAGITTNV